MWHWKLELAANCEFEVPSPHPGQNIRETRCRHYEGPVECKALLLRGDLGSGHRSDLAPTSTAAYSYLTGWTNRQIHLMPSAALDRLMIQTLSQGLIGLVSNYAGIVALLPASTAIVIESLNCAVSASRFNTRLAQLARAADQIDDNYRVSHLPQFHSENWLLAALPQGTNSQSDFKSRLTSVGTGSRTL
jgi:hypothetical protein